MIFWHHAPPTSVPPAPSPVVVQDESVRARLQAERALQSVRSQRPEVERVANSSRTLREQNHFGEAIEAAMRRRPRES